MPEFHTRRMQFHFTARHRPTPIGHIIAALSGYFPDGEEFFVRSVHHYADRITDPVLKWQVAAFIGQETTHAKQHQNLNDQLGGYLIQWLHAKNAVLPRWVESITPPIVCLAETVAMEHYTALLAQRMLANNVALTGIIDDPEVANLLTWHAFEELEHKAVAFDVYRAVGGPEIVRVVVMAVITAIAVVTSVVIMAASLARDRVLRRHLWRTVKTYLPLHSLWFAGFPRDILRYMRFGFHPDDIDTSELLNTWQDRLFGSHGTLISHLR
jgi:uncharacterized protein